MTLRQFLGDESAVSRSLVIVNRTAPKPVARMLSKMFEGEAIDVSETEIEEMASDTVVLVEDDEVIAHSSLDELQEEILLINSDLFISGARGLEEIEPLAVLESLADTPLFVRGYPESHSEKLPLILISRYIERRAWCQQRGTLRASFQSLDRITDEIGTHQVYQRLDRVPVDVHVYGTPGWTPQPDSTITAHAGWSEDFLKSWFVVYTPPEGGDSHAALLALKEGPNEWRGFWTYQPSRVEAIDTYIARNL